MFVWSCASRWAIAEQHYRLGWTLVLTSQLGWAILSHMSNLNGMMAFTAVSTIIALRGLWKLRTVPTAAPRTESAK